MATVFHFPYFLSLYSRKLFLATQQQQQQHKLNWANQGRPPRKHFTICACSNKKSRGSRKVKSNAELCNDIREFVTALGLPEDHVPSMKELLQHGRNDLANIVRRRGYKLIRELIANSTKSDIDELDPKKSLDANQDAIGDYEHISTGQDKKVNNAVEDITLSTDVSVMRNYSASSSNDSDFNSDDFRCLPVASSYEFKGHDEKVNDVAEDVSSSYEVSAMESSSSINQCLNTDDHSWMPIGYSVNSSLEEKASSNLQVQDEKVNNMVEDMPFSIGGKENYSWSSNPDFNPNNLKSMPTASSVIFSLEERPSDSLKDKHKKIKIIDPALNSGDDCCMPKEISANSSFDEKVARFIQNGDLDMIDDNSYGLLNESDDEESKEFVQPQNLAVPHGEEHPENMLNGGGNAAMTLNGSMLTSKHISPDVMVVTHPLRDDLLSSEGLMTAQLDKDGDTESGKREKQTEINHLKCMLHQKELELSWLKEQIEKEKDQIQYCGDGEILEVSGSFNGWHQRIKMDPQPSRSIMGPMASRKSRLWSTVLWLYPGIYEVKFIADGHWSIDPQRESITSGTICNNILRVDK